MSRFGGFIRIAAQIAVAAATAAAFTAGGPFASAAVALGGNLAINAVFPIKPPAQPDFTAQQRDNRQMFRSTSAPQTIPYGKVRASGPLYPIASTGKANEFLHFIVPLAGCEITSIDDVIINGESLLSSGKFGTILKQNSAVIETPWVRAKLHLGASDQAVDSDLLAEVPEWKTTSQGKNIAYLYMRLKFNRDIFPSGLQNVAADIHGRKIIDTRTGVTAWSDNWALCMHDYMRADFGLALNATEIDTAFISAAADTSDETVATDGGGTQSRYTVNGIVTLNRAPRDVVAELLTAGSGSLAPMVEGLARLLPGAYQTPVISLGDDDLRAGYSYQPNTRRADLFNTVSGLYAGPETNWQTVTYPAVGNTAYVAQDNGYTIPRTMNMPFCSDHVRCQRIAKIQLEKNRLGGTLTFPSKLTAFEVATMDTVNVTLRNLGWLNVPCRVISWKLNTDAHPTVDLILVRDDASVYAWSGSDAVPFVPPTSGPFLSVATRPQGLAFSPNGLQLEGGGNSTVFSGKDAKFTWRHASLSAAELGAEVFGAGFSSFDAWFVGYEITVIASGVTRRIEQTTDNFYVYTLEKNAEDGGGTAVRGFTVQVRVIGKQSQRSQPAAITVSNPPPSLPTNLSLQASFKHLFLSYDSPPDLDFSGVRVWASTTTGFTPDASTLVFSGSGNVVTLGPYSSGGTWYVRLSPFDSFGVDDTVMSSELSGVLYDLNSVDYADLSVGNLALADGSIDNLKVADAAIDTLKIAGNSATVAVFSNMPGQQAPPLQASITLPNGGDVQIIWAVNTGSNLSYHELQYKNINDSTWVTIYTGSSSFIDNTTQMFMKTVGAGSWQFRANTWWVGSSPPAPPPVTEDQRMTLLAAIR